MDRPQSTSRPHRVVHSGFDGSSHNDGHKHLPFTAPYPNRLYQVVIFLIIDIKRNIKRDIKRKRQIATNWH